MSYRPAFSPLVSIENALNMMLRNLDFLRSSLLRTALLLRTKLILLLVSGTLKWNRILKKTSSWLLTMITNSSFGTPKHLTLEELASDLLMEETSRLWSFLRSLLEKDLVNWITSITTLSTLQERRSLDSSNFVLMETLTRLWVSLLILKKSLTSVPLLMVNTSLLAVETISQ